MPEPTRQAQALETPLAPGARRSAAFAYKATIFASAVLLFSVQPMIAKAILPSFGGSAGVWATSLLFFQTLLLAGYWYADRTTRALHPKTQALLHLALIGASLAALPLSVNGFWRTIAAEHPILGVVLALGGSIGLPYLVLSTTSPLVQAWYAGTVDAKVPYRLYALSNLGSLLALLGYPVLVEPAAGTRTQLVAWSIGYAVFALLCAVAAVFGWRRKPAERAASVSPPSIASRAAWVLLAATPSALLVSGTNYLSQDVAPAPFLWVLPLSLYLLSFVFCFDHEGWYNRSVATWIMPAAILALGWLFFSPLRMTLVIPIFGAALFVAFMFCHGELARMKPEPAHLTSFYLCLALGGALGGLFVAAVAPAVLTSMLDFPAALIVCGVLSLHLLYGYGSMRLLATIAGVLLASAACVMELRLGAPGITQAARNFYGTVHVSERPHVRRLHHGRLIHGIQFDDARRRLPTTYYGTGSGGGVAVRYFENAPRRVGIVGLGVGTMAAYGNKGDLFRFYELNPLVEKLANTEFTFLRDSAAQVEVVLGDARVSLEREEPQGYHVLAVDAFSGDAIPVHLLTREAFQVYFRHLRPEGVLAIHISNQFLDLSPVVAGLAANLGKPAALLSSGPNPDRGELRSEWALISSNQRFFEDPKMFAAQPLRPRPGFRVWTDDYTNLLRVLR